MICAEHARELTETTNSFDTIMAFIEEDILDGAENGSSSVVYRPKDFGLCENLHEIFDDAAILSELEDNGYSYKLTSKKFKISW